MRLVSGLVVHHGVNNLACTERFESVLNRHHFASGREDRADPHQVELRDSCVAKRKFEGGEPLRMPANALGQKDPFSYWSHQLRSDSGSNTRLLLPIACRDAAGASLQRF